MESLETLEGSLLEPSGMPSQMPAAKHHPAGSLERKDRGRCGSSWCRKGPAGGVQMREGGLK
eukprot:scaffold23156_cov20-Tisochrysis_lutea.AAC.8